MAGKKALFVGINKFANYSQFTLNGCVNDAKDMAALYKDLLGFKTTEMTVLSDAQATKAKALFDYLFLRTRKIEGRSIAENLAQELRLDLEDFTKGDQDEFARYVDMSQSNKMKSIMADLRKTEWQN